MTSIHYLQVSEKDLRISSGISRSSWRQLMALVTVHATLELDHQLPEGSLETERHCWAERFWTRASCPGATDREEIDLILHEAFLIATRYVELSREQRPKRSFAGLDQCRVRKKALKQAEDAAKKDLTNQCPADGFINGDWMIERSRIPGYVNGGLTLHLSTNLKLFTYRDMVNNIAWEVYQNVPGSGRVLGFTMLYEGLQFVLEGDEAEEGWKAYTTIVPKNLMVHYFCVSVDGSAGEYSGEGRWCA